MVEMSVKRARDKMLDQKEVGLVPSLGQWDRFKELEPRIREMLIVRFCCQNISLHKKGQRNMQCKMGLPLGLRLV